MRARAPQNGPRIVGMTRFDLRFDPLPIPDHEPRRVFLIRRVVSARVASVSPPHTPGPRRVPRHLCSVKSGASSGSGRPRPPAGPRPPKTTTGSDQLADRDGVVDPDHQLSHARLGRRRDGVQRRRHRERPQAWWRPWQQPRPWSPSRWHGARSVGTTGERVQYLRRQHRLPTPTANTTANHPASTNTEHRHHR